MGGGTGPRGGTPPRTTPRRAAPACRGGPPRWSPRSCWSAASSPRAASRTGCRSTAPPRVLPPPPPSRCCGGNRHPVAVVHGTAAAALAYLALGYPYGPVFLAVAVGCFGAVVAGHRRAAWTAIGLLWAGHLLVALWLYHWLPPTGDRGAGLGQGDRRRHLGAGRRRPLRAGPAAARTVGAGTRGPRGGGAPPRGRSGCASPRAARRPRAQHLRRSTSRRAWDSRCSTATRSRPGRRSPPSRPPARRRSARCARSSAPSRAPGAALARPRARPRRPAAGVGAAGHAAAGLTVETGASPPRLPPGADLAAFRILQGLTNVVRGTPVRGRGALRLRGRRAAAADRRRRSGDRRGRRGQGERVGRHAGAGPPGAGCGTHRGRARAPTAASGCSPSLPSDLREDHSDPGAARRRPVAGAGRFQGRCSTRSRDIEGGRGGRRWREEAVRRVRELRPDVVLMDIRMPLLDGPGRDPGASPPRWSRRT